MESILIVPQNSRAQRDPSMFPARSFAHRMSGRSNTGAEGLISSANQSSSSATVAEPQGPTHHMLLDLSFLPSLDNRDIENRIKAEIPGSDNNSLITIYTNTAGGAYPYIDKNTGEHVFGGIPQRADLDLHAQLLAQQLPTRIPDGFDGIISLDFEAWWPILKFCEPRYKDASMDYARQVLGPNATEEEATILFEEAAQEFLTLTANVTRSLYPDAKIGFYDMPIVRAWWFGDAEDYYDQYKWITEVVDVALPSFYTAPKITDRVEGWTYTTYKTRVEWLETRIELPELLGLPIYAYTWLQFHQSNPDYKYQNVGIPEMQVMFDALKDRVDGYVLWNWENSDDGVTQLEDVVFNTWIDFINDTLTVVPFDEAVQKQEGQDSGGESQPDDPQAQDQDQPAFIN